MREGDVVRFGQTYNSRRLAEPVADSGDSLLPCPSRPYDFLASMPGSTELSTTYASTDRAGHPGLVVRVVVS